MFLTPIEILGVTLTWSTQGEARQILLFLLLLIGNAVVAAVILLRLFRTARVLLALLVLAAQPTWQTVQLVLLNHEARTIVSYVEEVKQTTGAYPADLNGYAFRFSTSRQYMRYFRKPLVGFEVRWWADQPGVSHWYNPHDGFDSYPD